MIFASPRTKKTSKNRSKNQSKKWSNLALIFDWFLVHFGSQHGPKKGQKSNQKSIQKSIKFNIDFWTDFGSILVPFWLQLGDPLGVRWAPFRGLCGSWGRLGAKMAPRALQDPSKSPPRAPQDPILKNFDAFLIDFLMIFWSCFCWFFMFFGTFSLI